MLAGLALGVVLEEQQVDDLAALFVHFTDYPSQTRVCFFWLLGKVLIMIYGIRKSVGFISPFELPGSQRVYG